MDLHDSHNGDIAVISMVLSTVSYGITSFATGEAIHVASIFIGAIVAFLTQKALHYFWNKYVK